MITLGLIMFIAGILGFIACGVSLCLLPKQFQKQRNSMRSGRQTEISGK